LGFGAGADDGAEEGLLRTGAGPAARATGREGALGDLTGGREVVAVFVLMAVRPAGRVGLDRGVGRWDMSAI